MYSKAEFFIKGAEISVCVGDLSYAYTEDGSGYCGMTMYKQNFGK